MAYCANAPWLCLLMYFAPLVITHTLLDGFQNVRPPLDYQRPRQNVIISDNGVLICQNNRCFYNSFERLNRRFPGLFPTVQEYQKQTGLPVMSNQSCSSPTAQNITSLGRMERSSCLGPGDGDDCCETFKYIVPYESSLRTRNNVNGQLCLIYQLFTIGTCGNFPESNDCATCMQQTSMIYLLAHNYDTGQLGFNLFTINSYCSCPSM